MDAMDSPFFSLLFFSPFSFFAYFPFLVEESNEVTVNAGGGEEAGEAQGRSTGDS
jgi:hypothetical protein